MGRWHGYEQAPGAHPSWPWWVWHEASTPRATWGPVLGSWVRTDGMIAAGEKEDAWQEAASLDRDEPLPVPYPKCGQVWVWTNGDGFGVIAVVGGKPAFGRYVKGVNDGPAWPPPGAVLVAGPGAPWANESAGAGAGAGDRDPDEPEECGGPDGCTFPKCGCDVPNR